MVSVLQESFERLGHTVVLPESGDFDAEIARLAPQCDYGLVIAPDEMLSKFTHTLELATHKPILWVASSRGWVNLESISSGAMTSS